MNKELKEVLKKKFDIKIGVRKIYSKAFKTHDLIADYDKEENLGLLAWSPQFPDKVENGVRIIHHLVAYLSMLSLIPKEETTHFPNGQFKALAYFVLQWERRDFNPSEREAKQKTNLDPFYEAHLISLLERSLEKLGMKKGDII